MAENDILDDLKSWHDQLEKDPPHGTAQMEIDILRRAIREIERLRAEVMARQ
jgi:hypothetical protein